MTAMDDTLRVMFTVGARAEPEWFYWRASVEVGRRRLKG